nr:protein plastid movement impaired 1-related 1-like [Tanacetum cinerariifolium]
QQIAWASTPSLEAPDREPDPEYVSLEDLAPLAMNKIEALSVEGLRIQSGMSDKDAPSNISPQSIGEISLPDYQ